MSASREKRLRRELREAEENTDIVKKKKKKKKPMTLARRKKIRSVVGTVVAVVLIVVFALLIFVNSGYLQKHATAMTVGEHKISPVEFNYFYQDGFYNIYSTYNSYGMWSYLVDSAEDIEDQEYTMSEDYDTWKDFLTDQALTNAKQVYTLYDAAVEAGYTLDEDAQASIDSMKDSLANYAESAGYKDADAYLEEYYGKGSTVESYVNYMTVEQMASGYSEAKTDSFEYTDDELKTYYDDNAQDFDKVTYRLFTVSITDDDADAAKATADSMLAELDSTEESFADAARKYAPEDSAEDYEDDDYTLRSEYSYSSVSSYDYGDWLFSNDRVPGESQVFEGDSSYSVVMFVEKDKNDYKTVNVRHILKNVEATGDDDTSTEEDWQNCQDAIDEVVAEWDESDQTEDTFATMAEEESDDTGSNTNGGLYEDVYKGEMVDTFQDWCFDESREVGNTGTVKTDYGWHFMYFSGWGDYYWKTLADDAMRDADYESWYDEESKAYTDSQTNWFGQLFTNRHATAPAS